MLAEVDNVDRLFGITAVNWVQGYRRSLILFDSRLDPMSSSGLL